MKDLTIGQICYVIDQKEGPRPVIVEELIERKTKAGTESFHVYIAGPPEARKTLNEQQLNNAPVFGTIEEVQKYLQETANKWVQEQCEIAERCKEAWYYDLLDQNSSVQKQKQVQQREDDTESIFKEISKTIEKSSSEQNDGPEIKISKPKGRPPTIRKE